MPAYYLDRIKRMLRISSNYGAIRNGFRLIEIGTGWLHWEAVTTRLFFDVEGILFDVWDNRQLDGLKNYLQQLERSLDTLDLDDRQRATAQHLISEIMNVDSFLDLYKLLGFEYVVDQRGSLSSLDKESFDLVVSGGVLEHIHATEASDFVNNFAVLLKPGGYSVHSINLTDHLAHYDNSVSRKKYLEYSSAIWRLCFENDVQYINRIQRSQWLDFFARAGLTLIEEEVETVDLSGLKVASTYRTYSENDLSCGILKVVHRKPNDVRDA